MKDGFFKKYEDLDLFSTEDKLILKKLVETMALKYFVKRYWL